MKCYLIRHGITEGNKKLRFNGSGTDEPLSKEGREALRKIDGVSEDAPVFSSPLIRARETAEIMFPGRKAVVLDDIREMHFGKLEGKNHEELQGDPDFQAWLESEGMIKIPGGESMKEFMMRTAKALTEAYRAAAASDAGSFYVVTHGGTIMALMSWLTGESHLDFNPPNGAGYEIEIVAGDEGRLKAASYDHYFGGLASDDDEWISPQYTPAAEQEK